MTRLFAAIALAFAVGAAAPVVHAADGAQTKTCRYKLSNGKVKTWKCRKDQPCCASETFGLYTCGSQLLQCL